MHSLEDALEGVSQAVQQARRAQQAAEVEAAECRAQGDEWHARYEREKEEVGRLRTKLAERSPSPAPSRLPSSLRLPSQPGAAPRRHTVPSGRLAGILREATAGLAELQNPPAGELQAEPSEAASAEDVTLARLGTVFAACALLHGAAGSGRYGRMTRQDTDGGDHTTVSVADDGTSGVGETAAAAVSVALAQSWAAVAGGKCGKQDSAREGGAAAHSAKARFKLVAAVPRSHTRGGRLPGAPSARDLPNGDAPADGGAGARDADLPASRQSAYPQGDSSSHLALESLDDARVLDDTQEATWRSSGSHLKLQWLSGPSTVLVVYKPTREVAEATGQAVAWLLRRGITVYAEPGAHAEVAATALAALREGGGDAALGFVSPAGAGAGSPGAPPPFGARLSSVDRLASDAAVLATPPPGRPCAPSAAGAASGGTSSGPGRRGDGGGGGVAAEEGVEALLSRLLLTWGPETCACADTVPAPVADAVDLVLTLGGDGTVLWACSLFATESVPPVVPLAMGSLGFMTPFPCSRMGAVLARVTSVDHSFPLMLRHRLQARILRGDASTADLTAAPDAAAAACGESAVVLNEVVIDRGPSASLANLQCYVDHNFVTTIQGDGLIVATPTGSTAYNLAAGGSMVHPSVPSVLFTPICPHTLSSRPLVFPEHVTLRVKVPADSRGEAYCSFDGKGRRILRPGDSVLIHLSQWPVPMVCSLDASHDWFLSVREGLNWNRRQAQKPAGH